MPKRRMILVVLALGILAALFAIAVYSTVPRRHLPPEPSYQGRSLSQWLRAADDSPVPAGSARRYEGPQASAAVRHIGTNAIPSLLHWTHYEESPLRDRLYQVAAMAGRLVGWKPKALENRQGPALLGFEHLGPQARPAIPALVQLMNDPKAPGTAEAATRALASVRTEEAFNLLLATATNTQHPARAAAIGSICQFQARARPAVPVLIQSLQDTNPAIVVNAASSLVSLKVDPPLVAPALAAHLTDSDMFIRQSMASMLANLGPAARPATPTLLKTLQDPNEFVRRAATNALRAIAPELLTNAPPK